MARLRLVTLVSLVMLVGCKESPREHGGAPGTSSASTAASTPAEEAKQLVHDRCAMCHGQDGRGDGPTAAAMTPKPRDWTDKAWRKSASDAEIRSAILGGGVSIGKSPLMPPNPDLRDKPAEVDELVKLVRSYGK